MQTIYIDISRKAVLPTISAKQGDVGRKVKVIFSDSGLPYDLSRSNFSVFYSGESGEGNYTDIGGDSAFEISGNAVTVELITQMLTNPGEGELCLVLSKPGGEQIGSWNIPYFVEAVPGADSEAAQDYYTAFSDSAAVVAKAVSDASRSANSARDSAARAAQSAKDAEDAALAATTGNPLVIGQGLKSATLENGKTELAVSNDIRYTGRANDKMKLGLDTDSYPGTFEGVELNHQGTDQWADLAVKSAAGTIGAGVIVGTRPGTAVERKNEIALISQNQTIGHLNHDGAALYASVSGEGVKPFVKFLGGTSPSLQLGCPTGNDLSIAAGTSGSTGEDGQLLTANGSGACEWQKGIRYTGKGIDTMEVGMRAYGGNGYEAVEFRHTPSGRHVRIGTRSSDNTSSLANINAGIDMGTISNGNGNAITFFSNGKAVGYLNDQGAALYGNIGGTSPVFELSTIAKSAEIGFQDGGNLSIVTGENGETGQKGQVLTSMGDSYCEWQDQSGLMMQGGVPRGKELTKNWASLQALIKAGDFDGIHIGDWKEITLTTGEKVIMEVAGIDQYYGCGDKFVTHHIDFISRNCLRDPWPFNATDTNNGTTEEKNPFRASDLFMNLQNFLYIRLPEDLKPCIIQKRMNMETRYSSTGALTSPNGNAWIDMGRLWLPSEAEVWGTTHFSAGGFGNTMGRQYPIFVGNSKHLVKYAGASSTRCSWWLCSPSGQSSSSVCIVTEYGASNATRASNESIRVPICFRVG